MIKLNDSRAIAKTYSLAKITRLAELDDAVEVLWLYGSRARGEDDELSDYDLAVAFEGQLKNAYEARLRAEELAMNWRESLQLDVSVVDIALAPAALAVSVVNEGKVIGCKNTLRLHSEEQKAWSKWEHYKFAYEQYTA